MSNKQAQYREIRKAREKEQTASVVILCRRFLERFPDHGAAWLSLGVALIELARYRDAEVALKHALVNCPIEKQRIVLSGLGHLEDARGCGVEARQWYSKAHEAEPDSPEPLVYLGCSYFKDGELEQAKIAHRKATHCTGLASEEAYFNLGGVYLALERFDEARECYLKALELDPEYGLAKERLRDVDYVLGILS